MKTTVLVCIDGLDPEYLETCDAPNLKRLGKEGIFTIGKSMMPSVTNVNNVSVVTGLYPETHGICSNYRLIRESGEEIYVESGEDILAETMFQRASKMDKSTVLVTSKDKLRTLLSDSATVSVSSEQPPDWVVDGVGEPPPIYSLEVNGWVIRAASFIMSLQPAEIVYVTTTDYAMHTYAPDEPESQRHITILDDAIGDMLDTHPDITFMLSADHGMGRKSRMVDLKGALTQYGVCAEAVPIIKDRYVVHHANLGGCMFVYVAPGNLEEAVKVLLETPGVEAVLERHEAAALFKLYPERIGDLVVTGLPDTVFGNPEEVEMPHRLRSHGSQHERDVPIFAYNGHFDGFSFAENRDIGRYVFERVLV